MGSGASSASHRRAPCDEPTSAVFHDTCQSRLDEELRWLRKTFETEKSEKEWLMKRHERMEQELSDRGKEIADLRKQLSADAQRGAPSPEHCRHCHQAARSGASSSPKADEEAQPRELSFGPRAEPRSGEAPGAQAPVGCRARSPGAASKGPGLGGEALLGAGLASPNSGLRERRNLKLSGVVTAKPAVDVAETARSPEAVQEAVVVEVRPAPVVDEAAVVAVSSSKRLQFLQGLSATPPGLLIEPMTDKSYRARTWQGRAGDCRIEPMSPLLGRRAGWSGGSINAMGVQVQPAKLLQMPDLVPCSPKRVPPKHQRWGSENSTGFETIGEGDEAEAKSPTHGNSSRFEPCLLEAIGRTT